MALNPVCTQSISYAPKQYPACAQHMQQYFTKSANFSIPLAWPFSILFLLHTPSSPCCPYACHMLPHMLSVCCCIRCPYVTGLLPIRAANLVCVLLHVRPTMLSLNSGSNQIGLFTPAQVRRYGGFPGNDTAIAARSMENKGESNRMERWKNGKLHPFNGETRGKSQTEGVFGASGGEMHFLLHFTGPKHSIGVISDQKQEWHHNWHSGISICTHCDLAQEKKTRGKHPRFPLPTVTHFHR